MSDQLKLIDARKPIVRAMLIVPVVVALLFSWYSIRWYMGNFVAEFAPRMEEGQLDAALAAMRLAPNDPWTHWVVAGLKKKSFLPGDMEEAVRHYEEAVRLSPNDYRFWIDLGRTREELGDREGGEKALRRAVELAPAYAAPRWYWGNLLLRAGRSEEAFRELRRAAEADSQLRPQLFNVAWTLYGQDVNEILKVVGDTAAARAEFAVYLIGRELPDDALRIWSGLQPAEKKAQRTAGEAILKKLLSLKRYRAAHGISVDLNPEKDATKAGLFLNSSFEEDIDVASTDAFNWQIKSEPQAQVAIDGSTSHNGARSLRIVFSSSSMHYLNNFAQLIVVDPSTQYRFECYVRAEDLKSAGTPLVEVVDATEAATVLGASRPLAPGTYDWQLVTVDFKTPPKIEAVIVRLGRALCGTDAVCPIFGTVWYDDFNLQRVSGAIGPRSSSRDNRSN